MRCLQQAEKFLGVYQSAIRLVQKGKLDEARRMLKNLIESDLMQKIDNEVRLGSAMIGLGRLMLNPDGILTD